MLSYNVTAIAASSSGDNTLIAADSGGRCIRVLAFVLSFSGSVNAKFQSKGSGSATDLSGLLYGAAGVSVPSPALPANVPASPPGHFQTNAGEALHLNLSAGTAVGGYVVWIVANK